MIEYIIPHDPDDRVIEKARKAVSKGELICAPTDTNWIVMADPFNKDSVAKLYEFKKEGTQKHYSLLVNEISKASEVALIDDRAFKLLKKSIPGHYTFIFEATKRIAKTLKASKTDKEIGLRFVPSVLIERLVDACGGILIGTHVPRGAFAQASSSEIYSYMIEDKFSHLLSLIIDPGELEFTGASTIIDFSKDLPEVTREGAGDPAPFM